MLINYVSIKSMILSKKICAKNFHRDVIYTMEQFLTFLNLTIK